MITQNGKAKAVLQDVATFEQTQEQLALLRILALGNSQFEAGKTNPVRAVFKSIRERHGK